MQMTSQPTLFSEPARGLLAAVSSSPPAHGIPAAVWLVLALNLVLVGFFVWRIVGLWRGRGEGPSDAGSDAAPRRNPEP